MEKYSTHRYGENQFQLYKLPIPVLGKVIGLVGSNGCGKTTCIQILAKKLKPNFGKFNSKEILTNKDLSKKFKGTALQNYFLNENKAVVKPQHIELMTKVIEFKDMTVNDILVKYSNVSIDTLNEYIEQMDLKKLLDRRIDALSGGALQRLNCVLVCIRTADVYIFDEPTNYLDIRQRINLANLIKSKRTENNYIVVIEHDLSILDYISDSISILYGSPANYGVVSMSYKTSQAINILLDGFIPGENMRFRKESFTFNNLSKDIEEIEDMLENADNIDNSVNEKVIMKKKKKSDTKEEITKKMIESRILIKYPSMTKTLETFHLDITGGEFILNAGITILLGPNGTGKTTLLKLLAGQLKPDDENIELPNLAISYKPQHIDSLFLRGDPDQSVYTFLVNHIGNMIVDPEFKTDVLNVLEIDKIFSNQVETLSGGERQLVAITLTLGKSADLYLIDEPSAFLCSEKRLAVCKAIKNFVHHSQKSVFIVEHDILMGITLGNNLFGRVIVFSGEPDIKTTASAPMALKQGMNMFLKQLDITFRQDKNNGRPRINKKNGRADTEQKKAGEYFLID